MNTKRHLIFHLDEYAFFKNLHFISSFTYWKY